MGHECHWSGLELYFVHPKSQTAQSASYSHLYPLVGTPLLSTKCLSVDLLTHIRDPSSQHLEMHPSFQLWPWCNIRAVIYTLGSRTPGCFKGIDHPWALIHDSGFLLQLLCQLLIPMTLFINYERFIPYSLLHKRICTFILQHDLLTRHHALHGKLNFWRLENLRKFHRFN